MARRWDRAGDGQMIDQFTLEPKKPQLRKIPLTAAQLGSVDVAELVISVDKSYVPAVLNTGSRSAPPSKSPRA